MQLFEKYLAAFPLPVECLCRARRHDRMAHGYLVHSDSALIREEFAIVLGMIAACPEQRQGRPCGSCSVCRRLQNGSYPELYQLSPVGKMRQIQVGDPKNPEPNSVRYFEEQFYMTSTAAVSTKIGIIHDADRLGQEAFYARLKTLEEPPPGALFLLATGNPSALLPTTRSRCQTIMLLENRCRFEFDGAAELFQALHELVFRMENNLAGAAGCAARLRAVAGKWESAAEAELAGLWQPRIAQAKEFDAALAKRLEKQFESAVAGRYLTRRAEFLEAIRTFYAQLSQLAAGVPIEVLANPEIFEPLLPLPSPLPEKPLAAVAGETEKLLYNLLFNVNETLALQSFCLQVAIDCKNQ